MPTNAWGGGWVPRIMLIELPSHSSSNLYFITGRLLASAAAGWARSVRTTCPLCSTAAGALDDDTPFWGKGRVCPWAGMKSPPPPPSRELNSSSRRKARLPCFTPRSSGAFKDLTLAPPPHSMRGGVNEEGARIPPQVRAPGPGTQQGAGALGFWARVRRPSVPRSPGPHRS